MLQKYCDLILAPFVVNVIYRISIGCLLERYPQNNGCKLSTFSQSAYLHANDLSLINHSNSIHHIIISKIH